MSMLDNYKFSRLDDCLLNTYTYIYGHIIYNYPIT